MFHNSQFHIFQFNDFIKHDIILFVYTLLHDELIHIHDQITEFQSFANQALPTLFLSKDRGESQVWLEQAVVYVRKAGEKDV